MRNKFYILSKRLNEELYKNTEIFFKEREFILGLNEEIKEVKIKERSDDLIEKKVTNEFTLKRIKEEITNL